jgi:hypothetical protein
VEAAPAGRLRPLVEASPVLRWVEVPVVAAAPALQRAAVAALPALHWGAAPVPVVAAAPALQPAAVAAIRGHAPPA